MRRLCRSLLHPTVLVAALLLGCSPSPSPPSVDADVASPAPTEHSEAPTSEDSADKRACARPCRDRPRTVGRFGNDAAPEASGIAASRRNAGLLYIVDDGPGTTSLLVVRAANGRQVGRLQVAGLDGVDTEGLAVGGCGNRPGSCIYVGDIGDNLQQRETIAVVRLREPDLSAGVPAEPVASERAALRYPDQRFDAETLLVDGRGAVGIVTKAPGRTGRGAARLYVAPAFGHQVLTPAGRVRLPPPRSGMIGAVLGNVVTGGDLANGRALLRTYDAIYEFTAPDPSATLQTLPDWRVREINARPEPQGEAVGYAADGCGVFTVSEGSGRLTAIPCKPAG